MPEHGGLFFSAHQVELARKQRARPPFAAAWEDLLAPTTLSADADAQRAAFRYRFDDNADAGARAVAYLQTPPSASPDSVTQAGRLILQAQCFELLRDHPALEHGRWQAAFARQVESLLATNSAWFHERLWLHLLQLVSGIVLEDKPMFDNAVTAFRAVVRDAIHPEGYIEQVVKPADGGGLLRQLLSVQALVLLAEAATQAGVDLWAFDHRGVSVATAATYVMFYYFCPEKWRWDEGIDSQAAQTWFAERPGFWELLHYRTRSKHIRPLLEELRPIHDVYGGGLTTLTHGVAVKRGLFR